MGSEMCIRDRHLLDVRPCNCEGSLITWEEVKYNIPAGVLFLARHVPVEVVVLLVVLVEHGARWFARMVSQVKVLPLNYHACTNFTVWSWRGLSAGRCAGSGSGGPSSRCCRCVGDAFARARRADRHQKI